jgi:broad specificity phosphatase PhoE
LTFPLLYGNKKKEITHNLQKELRMMPIDLVLVRHGESEGNVANRTSRAGDNSLFTDEFRKRHSSSWRLTDKGIEQAKAAGKWIRANFQGPPHFIRYYTSTFIRAMETAGLLDLPKADWFREFYLRERDWGDLDVTPENERKEKFREALEKRDVEPMLWTPPNGQPLVDTCIRVDRINHTMHRECSDGAVAIVCHAEVIMCFRFRIERMTDERFKALHFSRNAKDHIHNGQIVHYTRRNPETQKIERYLNWMRSICPWDPSRSTNTWQQVVRPRFSNEDLLKEVGKVKRLVNLGVN